jgi:hypothetical protein
MSYFSLKISAERLFEIALYRMKNDIKMYVRELNYENMN